MDVPLIGREQEMGRIRTVLAPDGPSVVTVLGPAGVGKSRLLEQVVSEADGWRVVRLYGGPAVRRVPFGAVAHLLDLDGLPEDPTLLFVHVRRAVVGQGSEQTLVVVDDAHELDEGTAAVVEQVAVHGEARVVLGVRTPPGLPPVLARLAGRADHERLTLSPLTRTGVERLLASIVGMPVGGHFADTAWSRSLGLPLFVEVLAAAAEEAGAIDRVDGVARLGDDLPVDSLHDLVRARMRVLDGEARMVVETLAVSGSLPRLVLADAVGETRLEAAIRAGYVVPLADGSFDLAHPVYGEAILEALPSPRRKELAGLVVDGLARSPVGADRIRLSMLTLDAGRPLAARDAASAAADAVARNDYPLAEMLASSALDTDPASIAARLSLARALGAMRRGEEADGVLRQAQVSTPEQRAEVAVARGHVLAFLLGRSEEAMAFLESEAAALPEALRAPLDADRALYGAMRGSFGDTIEAGERVLASPEASGVAKVRAATNLILARTLVGRFEGLGSVIEEALDLAEAHRAVRPLARFQCELTEVNWLYLSGRIREASDYSSARVRLMSGPPQPVWEEWHALLLDAEGDLQGALRLQRRAIAGFEEMDPFRVRPQAVGMLGLHAGQTGTIPDDLPAMIEEAEEQAGGEARLVSWIGRGKSWIEAVRTGPAEGAAVAAATGRYAAEHDHVTWAALAFHDAVRFGHARLVRQDFERWMRGVSGAHLVEAMLDHAVALDDGDGERLEDVARRFRLFGAVPLAAEVWAQLARLEAGRGTLPAARLAVTKATMLGSTIPSVRTPALTDLPEGLTDREMQVAARAAIGATSREIADELFLSVRTIDNHLASVYRKLDLVGRDELASALGGAVGRN